MENDEASHTHLWQSSAGVSRRAIRVPGRGATGLCPYTRAALWLVCRDHTGAILLYVSSTEAFWEEFATPIRRLLLARTAITKPLRVVIFIGLPLLLGWYFSTWASGSAEPPGGLRVIHPTPPASIDLKGKRLNLKEVTVNPLRADAARLAEHTEQGRQVYYKNCFFCHGDALDGNGHYAKSFNPHRRIFRILARLRSYQNPSCSGALPKVGQGCQMRRHRGIRPCRCGRTC